MFPTQEVPVDELKPVVLVPHPGISPGVAGTAGTAGVATGVAEDPPPPPPELGATHATTVAVSGVITASVTAPVITKVFTPDTHVAVRA